MLQNFISGKRGVVEAKRSLKNVMFNSLFENNIATKPMNLVEMALSIDNLNSRSLVLIFEAFSRDRFKI